MRILSQDGTIDIPYEQVVIQRFKEKIYFLNKNLIGNEGLIGDIEIASYSDEVKAQKAMELLREKYLEYLFGAPVHNVPAFAFVSPKVFQFPTDGELEG